MIRGYPHKPLEQHYKRAARFSQKDLLDLKTRKIRDPQVLVTTTFNPRNPNISKIIRDNWNIIENTDELKQIFLEKLLIGFRRLPNLRDILTSNKINYPPKPLERDSNALHPVCTRLAKCTYCPKLNKIDYFTSTHTKHKYWCNRLPPKHRLTCEIYNVIYLIHCTKCNI